MRSTNIRPSLRLYFIVATIVLVSLISAAFTALSIQNLHRGINFGSAPIMGRMATVEGVSDGNPIDVFEFIVASRWQDFPEELRLVFNDQPIEEMRRLDKEIVGGGIFTRPEAIAVYMKVRNQQGEVRYIGGLHYLPEDIRDDLLHVPPFVWVLLFAVAAPLLFLGGLLFLIRNIATPVESLKNWAKSLDEKSVKEDIPDFQYSELNALAGIVNTSLTSAHDAISREQKFLAHASHELRTPISVVRANTELLSRLQDKAGTEQKQKDVLQRIDRAGKTMTGLTETLLWLSRDNDNQPTSEAVQLDQLVEELVADLRYLLDKKSVDLRIETDPQTLTLAAMPCRIVLSNLIRNAFQHTLCGRVVVEQRGSVVTIINSSDDGVAVDHSDLGFGLGLRLSRELAEKYEWAYRDWADDGSYRAIIEF